jgi:hypothetical protein
MAADWYVEDDSPPRLTCGACGIELSEADAARRDAQGRTLCEDCYLLQQPAIVAGREGGAEPRAALPPELPQPAGGNGQPPELATAGASTFPCRVCGGQFPASGVYEADGGYVCINCFNNEAVKEAGGLGGVTASAGSDAAKPQAAGPVQKPSAAPTKVPQNALARIVPKLTCPHCWHQFPTHQVLWVSQHADLQGDPILGPDAPARFLPDRFNADGQALDGRGMACHMLACPRCHLGIPRPLLETEPLFASIIGVSASGKSYFLTSMTWQLRRLLPAYFALTFGDADPVANRLINHHEETLFLQADPDRPVKLDKTDIVGQHLYDQVRFGQQVINLPRPFLFNLRPAPGHPNYDSFDDPGRVVCLYDNAGEHFNPGEDTASSPVTQHLARSKVLMFLYDLTQDPRFRDLYREATGGASGAGAAGPAEERFDDRFDAGMPTRRQETILLEAMARVRNHGGAWAGARQARPLIVIVPKADIWKPLVDLNLDAEPIVRGIQSAEDPAGKLAYVDLGRIEAVSQIVRELLMSRAPEFVAAAEGSSERVLYVPVTALGHAPRTQEAKPGLWVRPSQIRPRWVAVPFLYMFARWSHGLLRGARFDHEPSRSTGFQPVSS